MDVMNDWSYTYENIPTEHDLLDKPGQIYNVDESGKKTMKYVFLPLIHYFSGVTIYT